MHPCTELLIEAIHLGRNDVYSCNVGAFGDWPEFIFLPSNVVIARCVNTALVQESRSLGFGNRPMLTLEGVHIHNQEMERVTALLDREHQLTKDQEDKEKRSESPAGGRHIGSLQAKLQALEKGSSEKGL